MDTLWLILGGLSGLFILLMTVISMVAIRKPRKISAFSPIFSGIIVLLSLLAMLFLGGFWANPLLALPALALGLLFGFVGGQFVKFNLLGKQVFGRHSLLFIFLWGFSLGISLLLGWLDYPLLASLGLLSVYFSTGLQLGFYANLFLRRLVTALAVQPNIPQSRTGLMKMLNLEVIPTTPLPDCPQPTSTEVSKNKTWVVILIVVVSVCLLVVIIPLLGYVMWNFL